MTSELGSGGLGPQCDLLGRRESMLPNQLLIKATADGKAA
jgi:hypothetical protein